jgi:hypothetical protein
MSLNFSIENILFGKQLRMFGAVREAVFVNLMMTIAKHDVMATENSILSSLYANDISCVEMYSYLNPCTVLRGKALCLLKVSCVNWLKIVVKLGRRLIFLEDRQYIYSATVLFIK